MNLYFKEGTTKIQRGSYSSDKTKLLNEKDLVVNFKSDQE